RDSKLTMLLRESLGNMNCRTTMIAHISASPRDFSETLFTIQIASRVLRMKKKKTKQYTSSSSGGESSCEEGRMRRPTHLRPFHHRGDTDSDLPLLRLSSDHDEYSSSEQSCDTVIYVGPNGAAVSDRELTDNEGPPEFVPIIPALLRGKAPEQQQQQSQPAGAQIKVIEPSQSLLGQPLATVPEEGAECLKCNTFAELQERLDCIDGSEEVRSISINYCTHLISLENSSHQQENQRPAAAGTQRCGGGSRTGTDDDPQSGPPCSPSQRCKVHTQKGVMPATPPLSSHTLAQDSQATDALTSDSTHLSDLFGLQNFVQNSGRSSTESLLSRSSPVGMSLQVQEPAPSLSASLGSAETLCDDDVPPIPLDTYKDALEASGAALSVGIVGPLSLGEDELAHPKGPGGVKNCDATAPVEIQGPISHPKSIISFKGDQRCATVHPSGLPTTTAGVTEVVAMAEVAMAKLRMDGETLATAMSNYRSPASSWMSDLSMGSDADQSLHSFSQSRSQQASISSEMSFEDPWLKRGLEEGRSKEPNLGVTTSTPCSPRATLDRRGSTGRQGFFSHKKGGIPPLPPVRKSSLDQRNRAASPLHQSRQRGSSIDSSRLFSAKLEQLANRTNSLGRERDGSLRVGGARGESTMPRIGRSLTRNGSVSSPSGNPGNPSLSGSNSAPQSPAKTSSQSKMSAVSKLLLTSSPKARSLSTSSTKTLSFSTKSLSQASSRSSSLPPNGKQQAPSPGSWSTQSLSRSRGGSLAAKLPLRAVNGRISELLQGSTGSRSRSHSQGGSPDPAEELSKLLPLTQTLPSPYSKITAPRKPHRCSSGHASDNSSSVLSGELPPAMGKTALFYHSGGSSGYESMLRDSSENTGSTSSAQDSLSEHSSVTTSSRRSSKSSKKNRNNAEPINHNSSKNSISPQYGPLGPPAPSNLRGAAATAETFEIKVYEIDDVERLHKRRDKAGNKEGVHVSARLRLMEHRQQRISEVRARYQSLRTELEQTKQHLMLEPHKWIAEFELQQAYEVDSLEYLEALETMTDRLETRVNFCKAHLMMITCFDVSSKHR
uniref:Kinesin family member 26B n=1 Tax=Tetraodon nigroviridis TaxID=99883 RepID=H3C572_TETNG